MTREQLRDETRGIVLTVRRELRRELHQTDTNRLLANLLAAIENLVDVNEAQDGEINELRARLDHGR